MINYPLSFFGESLSGPGIKEPWQTKSSNFKLDCSVPAEFEGSGQTLSPEDYFLLALQNCFIGTFKVYAEHSKLYFDRLNLKSELIVDRDQSQMPMMKTLKMEVNLFNPTDEKKAHLLIRKVIENGFILQSVKTEILHTVNFIYNQI